MFRVELGTGLVYLCDFIASIAYMVGDAPDLRTGRS